MAEQEEDFSQLPLPDRFAHKLWKVRKEGYEEAARLFEKSPDESDPVFRPFVQDGSIWKGAAADSNVAAQQEGLGALCAFLKYGGQQSASRSRPHTIQPIYEKGLSSTRPAAKANALECLLLYVEIDKPDLVIEELLPALANKQPKIVAATLAAITSIFHNFGVKLVKPQPALKALPKVFGHADKNVRAEAQNLTVELYRWLKDALKPVIWEELKPVQQTDLEKLFEKVREEPPPKQERFTRVQQAEMAAAEATADEVGGSEVMVEAEDEEAVEVEAFDFAEPQDVLSKVPENFNEMINSSKWKERKDVLDDLFNVLRVQRIKAGAWDDVIRGLTKSMKDANVAVVTAAANCIEKLALGLRKDFAKYRSTVMGPVMERLKEKKPSVAEALSAALDATFASTTLTECMEDIMSMVVNKNPNVKEGVAKFLVRCLRTTRDIPSKEEQKTIAGAGTKLLTESAETIRAAGAEVLGTLMKIIGERAMNPYLEGLDDVRKTKIKEFFDTAQVKAKEKPKPVAAPPKAAATSSALGKKVVGGGKKPVARKAVAAAPVEDAAPAPRPTAKALAKPGGVAKPGLAAPSGLKLGGLKKTSAASPQPRRVISPPTSLDDDDEPAVASPSKFGMGRGLAGRPLARPAAMPMSPPPAPAALGMSAIERAELEELRAEKERLTGLADSLRSSNAKLTAEITELQNQNAQLIEDHTRDVLQIKAKETQLTRARGECDVLRTEMESIKKETERYKREVNRLGRESIGRERDDLSRGRSTYDDDNAGGIYDDEPVRFTANSRSESKSDLRSVPGLQRTGSGTSNISSGRPASAKPNNTRPMSGFTNNSLSPSDEKENANGFENAMLARRKISPSLAQQPQSGSMSPVRPPIVTAESGIGGSTENWKRAAEVTSQLKARIEAMKARQLPRNQ
ncbi:Spindle pole body component alp14 [Cyphellophora attinorum]|uniref:Spindle pole body component alp14 n=1 Tax=Cyphellophora attinorum TaxID=1664694 RepID=A0A0N0NMW7_9EURO|nr:Spindle pole body component alp14 [Phialophora attinorum]KPI40828.1 Spindle pole body component alp14 [Phialophora attinorum]